LTTSRLYELRGELFDADEIRSFYQDDIANLDAEQRAEIFRELVALGRSDHRCAAVRSSEVLNPASPAPGKTRCREFRSVLAAVSAKPGGAMLSSARLTNNTGASLRAGAVRPGLPLGTFQAAQYVNT
jgi:hypothetical protein